MKVILTVILAGVIAYLGVQIYTTTYNPCSEPILYKIGTVDPKFKLSKSELAERTVEAANILNNAYGSSLFTHSESGNLTINFIHDERSALNEIINKRQDEIDAESSGLQEKIQKYEADVAEFKQRLDAHNATVQKYNSEGGAPPEVYNDLVKKQAELKAEGDLLNARASQLNLETNNYNSQVTNLNADVGKFNEAITQKPEEGIFDPETNSITIYFVDNKPELIHTLTHEFGHALSMNHVDNPDAIMYPLSSKTLKLTSEDKTALTEACEDVPALDYWSDFLYAKLQIASQNSF